MKQVIIFIIFFVCFNIGIGKSLYAQNVDPDHCIVDIEARVVEESGSKYLQGDIYLTAGHFTSNFNDLSVFSAMLEIRADLNEAFFNETNDFVFQPADDAWNTAYKSIGNEVLRIGGEYYMQIAYGQYDQSAILMSCLFPAAMGGNCAVALRPQERSLFGTFTWKLKEGATGTLRLRFRDYLVDEGWRSSGANTDSHIVYLDFAGESIEYDVDGAPVLVVNITPFEVIETPTDLTGNTLICRTPLADEYTVTVPASVDSCRWYVSSDEAGNNPVGTDVASVVVTEKGGKAVVTWKATAGVDNYYLQVQSLKDSKESDPIHLAVRIENFPDFAGSITEKIDCRSTELSWVSPKDGITVQLYAPDYSGAGQNSPFVCDKEDTYHFVRYRDANYCKDTVNYFPSFLNPTLDWLQAPPLTLQRGENFNVLLRKPTYPATLSDPRIEYIWTKPEVQDRSYVGYQKTAVNKSYDFEVFAEVNGCSSDTLTAQTTVDGGGIKPMLSSESGLDIACDGGILLKSQPDGGSGNYSYKWYANEISGTPLATTNSVWVTPTKNTTYFVVVTDNDSGEEVNESLEITYKNELSPVISAGDDQRIIAGTYTYLLASIVKDGASTDYTWNWQPTNALVASNVQNPQTVILKERQEYSVYVVDVNGCMSKPDTVNVIVDSELIPDLKPDDPDEEFALVVVPENATLCKNNSVQFELKVSGINLEGASYTWTPASGLSDVNVANPILTAVDGVVSGEYFVTIAKDDFSIVRKTTIKVNTLEEAPQLQLAENRMNCTGDVIQVIATDLEPEQYVWLLDDVEINHTGSSYTLVDAGEHTIKVYGKNSGSTCASDTLSVSATFGEGVILSDLTSDVTICGSETVLAFTSITPSDASFKWLGSDYSEISVTDKSITVQQSGAYYLVKGAGTCIDTTRIQVKLNNVLSVDGLRPVITGCHSTAELTFDSTSAPSFVWLDAQGKELANSKDKNPYIVDTEGIYQLRLEGGDCQETYSVVVLLETKPIVNGVNDELTTCGEELAICGSASEGTLYWAEDKEGENLITTGVLKGFNETKTYYVYADAGEGCKGEMKEVQVSFGSTPKVITELLQTTCDVPYTLQAATTGTGDVKWYESENSKTPISELITTADAGTSREYWACAEDSEECRSERVKVLVKFGTSPILEVSSLQTTCGEELELKASTTGGKLVWQEVGSVQELLLTRVFGTAGDIKRYEVHAVDGSCVSETKTVEVRFGANPEVLANSLYTTCGNQFTLIGSASGGTLKWYSDANAKNPLSSLLVNKGTTDVTTYYAQATDGSCQSSIKDVRVAFGSNPYVEVLTPQTSCKLDGVIALQATTTGGQLCWEKEDGSKLSSVLVNTAGTYYVYAEDGSCRSTKESVEVKFGASPVINVEPIQTSCGKEHTLVATTSGGMLQWYDSQDANRKEINTLITGSIGTSATYYVKAVDATCETEEKEVVVRFGAQPIVTVTPEMTTCESVFKLIASTTGGTLYWKEKESGKMLPIPQVTGSAGNSVIYTVYAQDATCRSTEQEVTVHYGNKPQIEVMPIQTACDRNHTLLANAEGDIKWYESDKVTELTNLEVYGERGTSSTYWVYVEKDGCQSDMTEVTVAFGELPSVNVITPQTTCGTSLTLEAAVSGGNAVWKKVDGSELTDLTVTGLSGVTDVYYVYAEDGSCKGAEEKVEVQFGTVPQLIVEKDITTCDEEYTLMAEVTDAKATIHWLEEDKQTPVTVAKGASGSSKKYYVYASTAECESPMTEVTVHFGASPMLNVAPISTCDTIAILTAQASVRDLVWTDEKGKTLLSTQVHGAAGTNRVYYVQAKDGRCVSQQEAVRVSFGKAPELIVEDIQTVCTGDQYELQAQATGKADIVWYQADGVTPLTSTVISKTGSDASIYYVEAREGTCVGDKKSVSVLFDQAPLLKVEKELQTTCGTSLTLQAVASAGKVVWMQEDGTILDLPQVSGTSGSVQHYYAYAQDGTCESTKKAIEVRFGTSPVVEVNEVQTACGESHTLAATASDGVLHWLEADKKTELSSTVVTGDKGTEKTYYVYAENGQDCQSELYPVTVMFGASPMLVDLMNPQTTCGTSVQLTAKTTAGTIEWRDELGNLLKTPLVSQDNPGEYVYYAQAKDETCSGASQAVTVKFGARPEVVCGALQTTCATSSYSIAASATEGILHYLTSDQKTELTSSIVNAAGTYYVYAKALDCVSDTVAVEVKFGTKPEVLLEDREQSTCEDVLQLQASATGGNIYWEKPGNNGPEPLLVPQVAATDGITMCYVYAADSREDESCRSEKEVVTLKFGAKPTISVEEFQTTCAVSDYELQASATDGDIFWFEQDGVTPLESTTVSGEANTTKSYWVYAERRSCRSDRQEVTVAFGVPPIVSVLDTLTSCNTQLTLSATTSAGTLTWLDENSKEVSNLNINNITPKPKTYYVYAKDGSCESVKHKVVTLFQTNPLVFAEQLQTTCEPENYELKAQASDGTLYWLDSNKNPLTSTIVSGKRGESVNYYVYAEKTASCKSEEYPITVEFGASPMLKVTSPQTVCGSGEVMVDLQASATGGKVVWEDEEGNRLASTQQKANAPETQYYYVHAEDKTCSSVTEKVEVRFGGQPVVLVNELQTACGESLTLSGTASSGTLVWSDGKNELTSLVVTPTQGDTYYVKAKDGECESGQTTVQVVFNTLPMVEVLTPQTTCGTQLQLEAQTTGGHLVWMNANGDRLNITQVSGSKGTKATYYVYAEGEGCESPREVVEVEFGALPQVIVEKNQTACGTSHVLTALATDGDLVWLDAAKKPLASAIVTGNEGESKDFYVYAKAIDCESEPQKVTVHFGQSPIVSVDALQTTCETALTLHASTTAGTIVWTAEDGTVLPTPVVTGNKGENAYYYATAEDGSCHSTTERVEVRFGSAPEVLLASDIVTTCGTEYNLEARASSGIVNWYASKESVVKLASTLVRKPDAANYAEYYAQAQNGTCIGEKQKVTVVFDSKPLVTVTTPMSSCDTVLVLSAQTTGGELVWMNSGSELLSTPSVHGAAGSVGRYYVQAQDASCQSEIKEVFVNFGASPSVNVETEQTSCETKMELQATASGGFVYWLKDNKQPLASTHVEGTKGTSSRYYVYAADAGCVGDTVEVNVAFGADPQIDVVDLQTSCNDVVELQAKTSGGILQWTTEAGDVILPAVVSKPASNDQLTCYVQAIDGTCTTDLKPVTVKFGAVPEIFAESLQTSCDTVYTLVATASAGSIVWEDEKHRVLPSATVSGTGVKTYYVYASVGRNCVSEKKKVKVAFATNPIITVEPVQTSCDQVAVNLKATASGGTLVWTRENGTPLTETRVTPEMGEIYQVYAQDGKCKSVEETVEVRFGVKPIVTVEPLQTTCGTSLQLQASASGGNIVWVNEDSEPISSNITLTGRNTQTVYVYAEDGSCMSEVHEVTVKFGQRPALHDLESAQSACASPYQLQASSTGGEIVWLRNGQEIAGNWVDLEEGENIFFVHVEDASCSPVASADEKVTVTLGGRPELTLSTTQCTGDTIYAEETNGMENLTYRWYVNGQEEKDYTGSTYVFADGGEYTLQVVAETENGCVSDTASSVYRIATPLHIAWDSKPANTIGYGNNISGCVKVVEGETEGITWNWLSPTTPAVTGTCVNIAANEPEYEFEVYAVDQYGCSSDTVEAVTQVTGFGVLDVALTSESGTEICKGGSALLAAEVTGGQAPYTYEWFVEGNKTPLKTVTTASTINVLVLLPDADATYTVKVRDSQLKPAIANKEIALTMKEATVPVANAGPDMTIQRGLQTLLKPISGDDITAWHWLPIDKLATSEESEKQYPLTAVLSTSQKYQLFVTNDEGCVSQPDDMVVFVLPLDGTEGGDIPTPPVSEGLNLAIQPLNDTLCLGAERWIAVKDLLGNLSGNVTYTWVAEPSVSLTMNAKRDSALFAPTAAGDYTFSVFVEDGGKKMALRSQIQVKDAQAPRFDLAVTGDCQQDTVKMTYEDNSLAATGWEWKVKGTTVANDADYYVLSAAGSYTVEVRAQNNGCFSDVKSVEVTVETSPVITDLAVVDSCGQAVIEVTATGATEGYTWTATPKGKAQGTDRYVISEEGEYQVKVVASNGVCSVERTLQGEVYSRPQLQDWITEPMDVAAGSDITAAVAVQAGGKAEFTYHWLQPDDAKTVTQGIYTQLAELANYTFEVYASDANGCISDTLKKSVAVIGGKIVVDIVSVYGKEICQGGAAMLVAHAQGAGTPCLFEWSKAGAAGYVRSATQNSEYDTLWVEASKVGDYQVAVRQDAASKILASAQIDGLTVSASRKAPVVTTESVLTIPQGGHTILLAEVTDGTPAYQWHWSPAGQLATPADTAAQYPQTADLDAKQEYQVYVTDAESCVSVPATTLVDVDDDHGLCVEVEPQTAEVCRNNTVDMVAVVSCGKPTEWDLEYSWEPSEQAAELLNVTNKDSVVFMPKANGEYTWIVKVVNGDMVAAARATVTVKDADAPILALQGRWDCVNDTLVLENSGEAAEKYVWTVDGIETAETGERFVLTDADVKEVRVYAQATNGCLSDTVAVATQLGIIPDVQLAETAFVSYPDSTHIIYVKQADGLTVDNYDFAWTSMPDNKINGSTSELAAMTVPMTEDVKYTFVATSKNNPVCQAVDTAWGYMIPKVAAVGIDKDEETGDLYLAWSEEELGLADSVRIMNIKWDGYAVESSYAPLTMAAGEVEKYIIDTSKDTLEFFYINASRYIPELGRSYYSLSSDTVGYFKQWLKKGSGKATDYNFFAYTFDMSAKGVTKRSDLLMLGGILSGTKYNIQRMSHWSTSGVWSSIASANNGALTGEDLELKLGDVFRVEMRGALELVLFGKLPSKYTYKIDGPRIDNYVVTPLSYGHRTTRDRVGEDMTTNIYQVGTFSFENQSWQYSTRAMSGAWTGSLGDYNITIFMPLQVILRSGNLPSWTK